MSDALVPVEGTGRQDGRTANDFPPGYITWEEHYEAYDGYRKVFPGQSAEEIANKGGFTYAQLKEFLGHTPISWVPRDLVQHSAFVDLMNGEPEEPEEKDPTRLRSHIWFTNITVPICQTDKPNPDEPFNFDGEDAPHCSPCLRILHNWAAAWVNNASTERTEK